MKSEPQMTHLAIGVVVIWSCGFVFLVGRTLNFIRLVYNNVAPDKSYWDSRDVLRFHVLMRFRFMADAGAIAPASLTEMGRQYQRRALRNDRILLAWTLGGVVLLVWASSYS